MMAIPCSLYTSTPITAAYQVHHQRKAPIMPTGVDQFIIRLCILCSFCFSSLLNFIVKVVFTVLGDIWSLEGHSARAPVSTTAPIAPALPSDLRVSGSVARII